VKQIIDYLQSFVMVGLILAGIGGAAYHMFKKDGWLSTALGAVWNFQMMNPVVAIPITIAIVVIGKLWFDHQRAKGYASRLPNILIYVVMLAGVYFIYQFIRDMP
jgi:hypothetical protein